jgi:cyclohexyl-isocyanide hydratase
MQRRHFLQALAAAPTGLAVLMAQARVDAETVRSQDHGGDGIHDPARERAERERRHEEAMNRYKALWDGPKLSIGMLVYPGMFLQDLVGPLTMFESLMNRDIHLLWKNRQTVANEDPGHPALIPVTPTTTFAECPERLDVLFVPGGVPGTLTMMEDREVLDFLYDRGEKSRYVTSVCTGSLILAAAGLLRGYRATSHWVTRDILSELGAIPTEGRIVTDRNRITGGGVTAGLDFGLELIAKLRNPTYAEAIQLYLEYDPKPPFDAGTPEKASAQVNLFMSDMFAGLRDATRATAKRAAARLGDVGS